MRSFQLQLFAEQGEKREPATRRKRERVREQGQVARSMELQSAAVFAAGVAVLAWMVPDLMQSMMQLTRNLWQAWLVRSWSQEEMMSLFNDVMFRILLVWGWVWFLPAVVGAGTGLAQTGLLVHTRGLTPDFQRINPLAGLKRIFSRKAVVEGLKALLKLILVSAVLYLVARWRWAAVVQSVSSSIEHSILMFADLVRWLGFGSIAVLLLIAAGDYAFQRWEFERQIRMTHRELKDERKEMEGDPLVERRQKERRQQLSQNRMLAEVERADVLITNPTHVAVAIQYQPGEMEAPVVRAKGKDHLAVRMRERAKDMDVTVMQDAPLARALFKSAAVGEVIPAQFYQAVAEVLAFVWRLESRRWNPEQGGGLS